MDPSIKLLILIKNIEGGTGTFLKNFLKVKNLFPEGAVRFRILVLEKPKYLSTIDPDYIFFKQKGYFQSKYLFSWRSLKSFLKEFFWVRNKVNDYVPQIILSIDVHSNLLIQINKFFLLKKVKTVITTHNNLLLTLKEKSSIPLFLILKFLIRFFYEKADQIICISKGVSKSLKADFNVNSPISTIYYGIQKEDAGKKVFSNKKPKIIFSAARLDYQKDFETLIRAFYKLQKELPNTELWIAGEGPLKKELKKLVESLEITKKVKFLGWVQDIKPYLRRADIFVLSTKREGFGYVLLEAMSQSIPVISTNVPYGPSEILGMDEYGILVPVGDKLELKQKMIELLVNPKKYRFYSRRAYQRSLFFSLTKMLNSYKTIINHLSKN